MRIPVTSLSQATIFVRKVDETSCMSRFQLKIVNSVLSLDSAMGDSSVLPALHPGFQQLGESSTDCNQEEATWNSLTPESGSSSECPATELWGTASLADEIIHSQAICSDWQSQRQVLDSYFPSQAEYIPSVQSCVSAKNTRNDCQDDMSVPDQIGLDDCHHINHDKNPETSGSTSNADIITYSDENVDILYQNAVMPTDTGIPTSSTSPNTDVGNEDHESGVDDCDVEKQLLLSDSEANRDTPVISQLITDSKLSQQPETQDTEDTKQERIKEAEQDNREKVVEENEPVKTDEQNKDEDLGKDREEAEVDNMKSQEEVEHKTEVNATAQNDNDDDSTNSEEDNQPVDDDDEDEESEEEEEEEEDDDDDDDDDEEDDDPGPAPKGRDIDEGWAWVVLAAAFLGMTIFGTFTFSTGIFQAEILQVMEPDVQKASWVGATHLSTLCMMGPFAGLIKNRLGSRITIVMSSLVICVGMVGASFAKDVTQLILTYGVITGIGTGMALNPIFVCVGFYFERYRGFASGVIAAGSGAGMFIGGPIIRHVMETYGLSGAFLIWGAVGLNIAVAGMVMRPSSLERDKAEDLELVYGGHHGVDPAVLASVSTLHSAAGYWGSVLGASSFLVNRDKEADAVALQQSQMLLEVPGIQSVAHSCSELSVTSRDVRDATGKPIWRPRNFRSSQLSVGKNSNSDFVITVPEALETTARTAWLPRNILSSQLSMGDSIDSVSIEKHRMGRRTLRGKARLHKPGSDEGKKTSALKSRVGFSVWKALTEALDSFRFVRNAGFLFYILSASVWVFGESIVFTYLPTYATAQGSSPFQSATLITAVGLTSTLSRLIVGFVAGDVSIGPDLMHIGMLGLCGLCTITFPLYSSSFSGQVAYSAIYGLYSGGLASVINILIISFIGVEQIALAFGLICFGQGVASLLGPTIAGAIVSNGGSYDDVFLFSGSLLLLAALFGFPMVLWRPRAQEVDIGVEEKGETTRSLRVRIKGERCHT